MGSIAIVGLDESGNGPLTEPVRSRLERASSVVVPGQDEAITDKLVQAGLTLTRYEDLELAADAPSEAVVDALVHLAEEGDVAVVAAGYPLFREGVVSGLLARSGVTVDVLPVISPLEVLPLAFDVDPTADLVLMDAGSFLGVEEERRGSHLIVRDVRTATVAHRVAERLARVFPLEHRVILAGRLDDGGYALDLTTVEGLRMVDRVRPDASLYVPPVRFDPPGGFDELVRLVAVLRGPDGCPWDLEQDHLSLRQHMIEEAYEVVGAIDGGDAGELADELGDVLLQVALHAQIASEADEFTMDDVTNGIIAKIRRRHPHIFGGESLATAEEVRHRWDSIKRDEKEGGILDGVTEALPALAYAQKISRRAVSAGFEWETIDDVWAKVHEELDELRSTEPGTPEAEHEIGDVLFTIVNLARKQGIDAESALRSMCERFRRRFGEMEAAATERGVAFSDLDLPGMEELWVQAKRKEDAGNAGGE